MTRRQTWSLLDCDDFGFDASGCLVLDSSAATPMKTALTQHFAAWWAYPGHGSRLAALMAGEPEPDLAVALDGAVRDALAPLERAGRIRDLDVRVDLAGNRARIVASAHDIGQGTPVAAEVTLP